MAESEVGKMIYGYELQNLLNYLCGNVNSDYSPNRSYYYHYYNLLSHIYIVARWRRKHGLVDGAKLGERICYNEYSDGILINLNEDKEHTKHCYRCK